MAQQKRPATVTPTYSNTYAWTSGTTACTTIQFSSWGTAGVTYAYPGRLVIYNEPAGKYLDKQDGKLVVPKGEDLLLPDGSVLKVDDMGNYSLDDKDAKVVYQANRMREFNPYVNASDLLAGFIRYLGSLGITKFDAGNIPVALFVNWLVIEAATKDGDPIPDGVTSPAQHPALKLLTKQAAA